MKIELRHIGYSSFKPSKIIEISIKTSTENIVVDVTDYKGRVDAKLINDLREIADSLEHQNNLINELNS